MSGLSAAANIVLNYARSHQIDGCAEIGDDIQLPEKIVIAACNELKSCGKISDFSYSEESVEFIIL